MRTIRIAVPTNQSEALIARIREMDGVIGLRFQPGISLDPPGDILTLETTNRALHPVMRMLLEHGVASRPGSGSITTSRPLGMIAPSHAHAVIRDTSESTWEEMELTIARESSMSINGLLLMAIGGFIAVVGIATNALHIVIGAMIIAPGFEPISRAALGVASRSPAFARGLKDTALAYLAMTLGAAAATLILTAAGKDPLGGESSYLPKGVLISYWVSLSLGSILISMAASFAGALLIATNRSVLTGGVMIALALVPTASISSMALTLGRPDLAGQAAGRWLLEAAIVAVVSLLVFAWKRVSVQKRRMAF